MLIRRQGEAHPLHRLRGDMDRLFNDLYREVAGWTPFSWAGTRTFPALNAWEDDQNLYVEAEIPGMKMDNIEVVVVNNELTIKGERPDAAREDISYHRRERGVGTFGRLVRLPIAIDADKVEAALTDGVLTITLPKAAAAKPRKIQVKSS